MAYDTRPHDWSIRSNSEAKNSVKGKKIRENSKIFENFVKKPSFEENMSVKCLVLCISNQLVVCMTINYNKRVMMEREKSLFELTDINLFTLFTLINPQNKG